MAGGQVQLAYTEWTLVELGGAPVDVGPDERPPHVVLDLEKAVLAWLAYPLAWFAYTLARGADVDWYPYPFVDVSTVGYGGALGRSVLLVAGFAVAGAALLWLGNRRALR